MEKTLGQVRRALSYFDRKVINSNFRDKFQYTDRSNNSATLAVILAGKKSFLWKYVFPRVYADLNRKIDVIIANPGDLNAGEMRKIAREYGFSYLATNSRKIAPAVNLAIRQCSNAKWIYKLDDDVFINRGFFANLKETHERVKKEEIYEPGMTVPLLNINNFSYVYFLKTLDLIQEYVSKFGNIKLNGVNSEFYRNGEAAAYIWSKSLPLGKIGEIFAQKNKKKFVVCPFRFSISAILFERDLWEQMRGFKASAPGTLGADEESINNAVIVKEPVSQIIVSLDNFAGHFGYFTHMKDMMAFFHKNERAFKD